MREGSFSVEMIHIKLIILIITEGRKAGDYPFVAAFSMNLLQPCPEIFFVVLFQIRMIFPNLETILVAQEFTF